MLWQPDGISPYRRGLFSSPGFKLANDSGRDVKLYLVESILLTEGWWTWKLTAFPLWICTDLHLLQSLFHHLYMHWVLWVAWSFYLFFTLTQLCLVPWDTSCHREYCFDCAFWLTHSVFLHFLWPAYFWIKYALVTRYSWNNSLCKSFFGLCSFSPVEQNSPSSCNPVVYSEATSFWFLFCL